jgi:hypothetical protein
MTAKLEKQILSTLTRTANAVLTANRFVKLDTDTSNVIVCTANARALGVVPRHAHVGDPVTVETLGFAWVEAGDVLATPGTMLVSDATGRAVAAGATGDQNIAGIQMTAAGAAGELVGILLWPTQKYAGSAGGAVDVTQVVNAEVVHPTHTITVTAVLKDYLGAAVTVGNNVLAYLSDDNAGQTLVTGVLTADAIIATDGMIVVSLTAKKAWLVTAEANGQIGLTFAKTDGAASMYLNIVTPDGKIHTSTIITFSA